MKKITDAGLLNIVGKVLDDEFIDFGSYQYKRLKIGFHKIYDQTTRNEYHRDYARLHAKPMNETRRKVYAMLKKVGKCPRCRKKPDDSHILCSGCRKVNREGNKIKKMRRYAKT